MILNVIKRPVEYEAVQYKMENLAEVGLILNGTRECVVYPPGANITVAIPGGATTVKLGDYIVKNSRGQLSVFTEKEFWHKFVIE